jgi:predicted nucleic acid binding AN1-type Zn finger protein
MTKCNICTKRINFTEQIISLCTCGSMHCSAHRLPEFHNCNKFDEIKKSSITNLQKTLPKVEGEKMIKI